MKRTAAAALMLAIVSPACADDVSADLACKLHHAVVETQSFPALPKPVSGAILSKTHEMADRGAAFNATDVIVKPAPAHRFIRAGHAGDTWFVWYEHGGIAYSKNIVVLNAPAGAPVKFVAHLSYFNENPCTLTDAALDRHEALPVRPDEWW